IRETRESDLRRWIRYFLTQKDLPQGLTPQCRRGAPRMRIEREKGYLRLDAGTMTAHRQLRLLPSIAGRHRHPVDDAKGSGQECPAGCEEIAVVSMLLDQQADNRAQRLLLRIRRHVRVERRIYNSVLREIIEFVELEHVLEERADRTFVSGGSDQTVNLPSQSPCRVQLACCRGAQQFPIRCRVGQKITQPH